MNNTGWSCPHCNTVYAPTVQACPCERERRARETAAAQARELVQLRGALEAARRSIMGMGLSIADLATTIKHNDWPSAEYHVGVMQVQHYANCVRLNELMKGLPLDLLEAL